MKMLRFIGLSIAVSLVSAFAMARDVNASARGDGTLTLGAQRIDLERAVIILRDEGQFDATVYSRRDSWRFSGRYTMISRDRFQLDIRGGSGAIASGAGTLYLQRNEIDRIEMSGSYNRQSFRVNFTARESMGPNPGGGGFEPPISWGDTVRGAGFLRVGNDTSRIDRAKVALLRNNQVEISVWTTQGQERRFKGTWNQRGNAYDISIDAGMGEPDTTGRGQIWGSGRNLSRMELDGRYQRSNWALNFNASDTADIEDGSWMSDTQRGDGRLRIGGNNYPLDRAKVSLGRGGRAEIWLIGRSDFKLLGTWTRNGQGYEVRITDGLNRRNTTGAGTISRRGNTFELIKLNGRSDGQIWGAEFDAKLGGGGGGNNNLIDLDKNEEGTGTLRRSNATDRLFKAFVGLERNGNFSIRFDGDRTHRYTGTWTRVGNEARLRVTGGAIGNGTLYLQGGSFSRIEMDMRDGSGAVTVRFQVR